MIRPDQSLKPDWDEGNIDHIAIHGIRPEQVEEVYYNEGPFPTLAVKSKKKRGKSTEYRYLYGVQMPLDSVSKPLWLHTPSMVCGDA